MPSAGATRAVCHGPPSTFTSTAETPRCGAQAAPATATWPALTWDSGLGTSIRDWVLIGACRA